MKRTKEQKSKMGGITLIALVITVIVLLILAGVSISMLVGENGILNRATDASQNTRFASEKEAIEFVMSDIKTGLMINEEIPKEKYIGEKLSSMSAITGDWKNVTVGENTYKDGWYLVEKGDEITGYGEAKYNWLINYDTGEMIELKVGEYTIANANASGAIVDETLKLNIDPVNLQNPDEWGAGVSFHGGELQDVVSKSELKFDGIDDYLKIENINIEKSDGVTFEFYGHCGGKALNVLNKLYVDEYGEITGKYGGTNFRSGLLKESFNCCFGTGDSESNLSPGANNAHWIIFDKVKMNDEDNYISVEIDFINCEIKIYQDGCLKQSTKCSKDYLETSDVFNSKLPFFIGVTAGGDVWEKECSEMNLYACRLYTRMLSDTEINQNYIATTKYHSELLK